MNRRTLLHWCCGLALFSAAMEGRGQWLINEILLNPPGGDSTNEFIELRGPPNSVLPAGTWLVAVEGDAGGDPGTIQNLFDLSGRTVGQNGFLVLLQKFHRYPVNPLANVVTNADQDGGWGTGASSTVQHEGEGDQIELENASCTFLLIRTATPPAVGEDIDGNDDGTIDTAVMNRWTILDSVGVLDADGSGDVAYGWISFRRNQPPGSGAAASGTVVPVPFTPAYVARNTNSTGWAVNDWVASDNLLGTAPRWLLGSNVLTTHVTNTVPAVRSRAVLNHLGGPNFGARPLPAVWVRESAGATKVIEGGLRDSYTLNLALAPTGAVTLRLDAEPPLQISLDGVTFTNSRTVNLTTTAARRITVRVPDDRLAGPSPLGLSVRHTIISTRDAGRYPTNTIILPVAVSVMDNDSVLLSEAKVNPPGMNDAPYEFVELTGPPGMALTNLWLLAVQGNGNAAAGTVDLAVDLTGAAFGTNGLLVIAATNSPYTFASGTAVWRVPQLARSGGALDNDSCSILLVGSVAPILEGNDLDAGNNGVLEGLPAGAVILDAVAWTDGGPDDVIYGGVDLTQSGYVPDAATRLRGNLAPLSAAAWAVGDLLGTNADSLSFDYDHLSPNLPPGSILTPGVLNRSAPTISALTPVSHVIGHSENATVSFVVSDAQTPAASLVVTAVSTNQAVVPDANLRLARVNGGAWILALEPVGVGYSDIILSVNNGTYTGRGLLRYAASAPGRPGGYWHTGVSDASTAIPVDASWVLIGDDENQNIRLFNRMHSGPAVKSIRLNDYLDLVDLYDDGSPKEVDIEGSFRAGNRIFWLGSHSHSMNLLERTNRSRIFATSILGTGTDVSLVGIGHYDFLKIDLLNWDEQNRHGRGANYYRLMDSAAEGVDPKAPDGSGFNLEGLCAPPEGGTGAWIAFRAPLVPPGNRVNALILPVLNYTTLATGGGGPGGAVFGPPIELNLGGRGVRSIEGSGTNYLIVAGPPGAGTNLPPPGDFRLFTWSGRTNDPPRERSADLWGLSPEAMIGLPPLPWTTNSPVHLVSDNGAYDFYNDGMQAKHLPIREFKKFRIDTVTLGGVVASAPQLRAVRLDGSTATVEWLAQEGTTYQVQCKTNLKSFLWTDVPGDVVAAGPIASKTVPLNGGGQCFFRVVVRITSP